MPRFFILLIVFSLFGILPAAQLFAENTSAPKKNSWTPLFDGKSLKGWKATQFGGEGEVYVEDETIFMEFGSSMTGLTATQNLPRDNYEVRLEAKRIDGTDFFCGLTFPVKDNYLTLVVGGWGGAVVGLSSIDGDDASENDTRRSKAFKKNQWYSIRLRVSQDVVTVWIDDKELIKRSLTGHELSLRPEVNLCRPFGICAWETRAALRKLEIRSLNNE